MNGPSAGLAKFDIQVIQDRVLRREAIISNQFVLIKEPVGGREGKDVT